MKITLTDGRVLDAPDPKAVDIVAFERKFKMGAGALADDPHVEHALFLAWAALKRTGQYTGDFDAFLDELDDFEGEADPLVESPPTPSVS